MIGISHTHGGNVVVVDLENGRRWDMTPKMATDAANALDLLCQQASSHVMYVMPALDDRSFRFAGHAKDGTKMVMDLRQHAAAAKQQD